MTFSARIILFFCNGCFGLCSAMNFVYAKHWKGKMEMDFSSLPPPPPKSPSIDQPCVCVGSNSRHNQTLSSSICSVSVDLDVSLEITKPQEWQMVYSTLPRANVHVMAALGEAFETSTWGYFTTQTGQCFSTLLLILSFSAICNAVK